MHDGFLIGGKSHVEIRVHGVSFGEMKQWQRETQAVPIAAAKRPKDMKAEVGQRRQFDHGDFVRNGLFSAIKD